MTLHNTTWHNAMNYHKIAWIVILAGAAMIVPMDVWANDPFAPLCDRLGEAYVSSRKIVYVIAGIATLSLGTLAFFGRFKWTTFFAMVGGLFMISIFDQILGFATQAPGANAGPVNGCLSGGTGP